MGCKDRAYEGSKPHPEAWVDLCEYDPIFNNKFSNIFNNPGIPEADDYTPEVMEDTYLNMELAIPKDGDGPEFSRVTKRIRDANGLPIGCSHDNPLLYTRVYEVEYSDGHKASLAENAIAINMFSQVDEEGNRHVFLDDIVDHFTDGDEIKQHDAFITSNNGGRRRHETTKGWEILLQWKDGSTSWETLKEIKKCYSLHISEYAVIKRIPDEPAFS